MSIEVMCVRDGVRRLSFLRTRVGDVGNEQKGQGLPHSTPLPPVVCLV